MNVNGDFSLASGMEWCVLFFKRTMSGGNCDTTGLLLGRLVDLIEGDGLGFASLGKHLRRRKCGTIRQNPNMPKVFAPINRCAGSLQPCLCQVVCRDLRTFVMAAVRVVFP